MQVYAGRTQLVAAALEALLHCYADALHCAAGLTHDVDKSLERTAVSEEVVDNQHMVILGQKALGDNNIVHLAMGIGINLRKINVLIHIAAAALLRENNRHVKIHCCNAGNTNARSLNGQNLVDRTVCKLALQLLAQLSNKRHINLMVQKAVDLEDVAAFDNTIFKNFFF